MDTQNLAPRMRKWWRVIINECKLYEYSLHETLNGSSKRPDKPNPHFTRVMNDIFNQIREYPREEYLSFIIDLLDEPLPLVWSFVINILSEIDDPYVNDVIREISESPEPLADLYHANIGTEHYGSIYGTINVRNRVIRPPYKDLRKKAGDVLLKSGLLPTDTILTSADERFLDKIIEQYSAEKWLPLFYKRIERNLDSIRDRKQGPYFSMDHDRIPYLSNQVGLSVWEGIDYEIAFNTLQVLLSEQSRDTSGTFKSEVILNLLKIRQWELNFLIEVMLPLTITKFGTQSLAEMRDSSKGGERPILYDIFSEIKNQIASNGELKDMMMIMGWFTKNLPNNYHMGELSEEITLTEVHRQLLMEIITELGNKLVKGDASLAGAIDPILNKPVDLNSVTGNMRETIEKRRCCQMHGRTGDRYCNICGRIIPEEMRVEN